MNTDAKTFVGTVYGNSKCFEEKLVVCQGSALSPLLFVTVMEAIFREFKVALPLDLLYADDFVAEIEDDPIKRSNEWNRVRTDPGKSWKVLELKCSDFQAWKVLEKGIGLGKPWKSPGILR